MLDVSLSAILSYRQCQQQYAYRYVERLRRKDRARHLELGSILHRYLELYYIALQEGIAARDAHDRAQWVTSTEFLPTLKRQAQQLHTFGHDELAHQLLDLMPIASRITERYFLTRGESDAEEYEVLYVEEPIEVNLTKTIRSRGKLDMVTRQRDTGNIHLWEHKSTENVPSTEYRLRDLQTTLYEEKLIALDILPAPIDAVNWNYIRTKEPTKPKQLKNGQLTTRADLDSTWEVYAAEITRLKLNFKDYEEQRQRLEGREESVFFPRHEQVILADSRVLMRDYLQTAKDIRRSRKAWEQRLRLPVRTFTVLCDWCEFKDLCNARLLAGSDRDARGRYEVRS